MITASQAQDIVSRSSTVDRNNEAFKMASASAESHISHAAMLGETSTTIFIDSVEPFTDFIVEDLTNAGFTVELDEDEESYTVSW